jgi:uncharacterized protein (TIGR03083 family)
MSPDPRTWITGLRNSHDRLRELVLPLSAEQLRSQSYCRDWSIAQVLSHLGSGAEIAAMALPSILSGNGAFDREKFPPIWDSWNARSPEQQAADCLSFDAEYVTALEKASDEDLARMRLEFFGMDLDAAGVVRLRLGEHAIHTWDVAVSLDPAAVVAPDAVALLATWLPVLASRLGRPGDDTFAVRVRATEPFGDFLIRADGQVTVSPWPGAGTDIDGEIGLPMEALVRLGFGRLDPGHTPAMEDGRASLDRLRQVFPGF